MTENDDYTEPHHTAKKKTDRPVDHLRAVDSNTISDIDLQALVDGALDAKDEKALRVLIAGDSSARTRYRELLEQKRLLIAWWRQFS